MSKKNNKNNRIMKEEIPVKTEEIREISAAEAYMNDNFAESKAPKKDNKEISPAKIVISLTLICAVIAGMLGAVNYVTKDKISENTRIERENSIKEIFDSSISAEEYSDFEENEAVKAVYLVTKDDAVYGYCVNVSPSGFGGAIDMMVGIDSKGKVCGVSIVSMSETPGLGSKTNTPEFLGQFNGRAGNLTVGESIDAVSGATISSRAVTSGVSTALSVKLNLEEIAAKRNTVVWTEDMAVTDAVTEVVTEASTVPQTPVTEPEKRLEDTLDYVEGIGDHNEENIEGSIDIEVFSDTTVYITETEKPETNEDGSKVTEEHTTTEKVTTKAPETTTKAPETTVKEPETTTAAPETTTSEPETTTSAEEPATEETTGLSEDDGEGM